MKLKPEDSSLDGIYKKPILNDVNFNIQFSAFVIGFSVLSMEVIWTRIQVQYFSATVYSFSIMLLSVLLGIYSGSNLAKKFIDRHKNLTDLYLNLMLALGISICFTGLLIYVLPGFYLKIVFALHSLFDNYNYWHWITIITKTICASLFIFIPCIISGILFPVAVKISSYSHNSIGKTSSMIYFWNTVGSVFGPLITSFALIPILNLEGAYYSISLFIIISAILFKFKQIKVLVISDVLLIVTVITIIVIVKFIPDKIVANYSFIENDTELIFHEEGNAQTISLLKNNKNQTIFMIDGNIEADNSPTQMKHFIIKGHLPLILHPQPENILVIGLGMGITLNAIGNYPSVKMIDLVELSPQVIKAQKYLININNDVLNNDKLNIIVDDGRNFLSATKKKYDMITIDPIHPRISGVGTLYTDEFYKQVKSHLTHSGIYIQWMPSYQMSPYSFKLAVNTFITNFPNAFLWYVKGHALLLGKNNNSIIDYDMIKNNFYNVQKDMEKININSVEELLSLISMTPDKINKYTKNFNNLNNDNNLYLEYHVPGEYLYQVEDIIESIFPYWGFSTNYIINSTQDEYNIIIDYWEKRKSDINLMINQRKFE